jgi:hypothetical protein
MTTTDVRRTRAWRDLVTWAKRNLPWVCHLCGGRIPRGVHRFHPLAYELDHKLTVRDHPAFALAPSNVAPSHRQCNSYRKARPLTPGLVLEITERFTVRPPAALDFFSRSPIVTDDAKGGGVESTQREGPP